MKNKKKIELKRLYKYLKPYMLRMSLAILCMIIYAVMDLVVLTKLNEFIDQIFSKSDTIIELLKIALIIPALYAITSLADYSRSYFLNQTGQNVVRDLRIQLHGKLMSLSHSFYVRNSSAKLMSRVTNDLGAVQGMIVGVPATLTRELLIVVGMTGYVFYLNWKFALIVLVGFPLAAIPLAYFAKRIRKSSREVQHQMAEIYSSLAKMLNGFSVIRAFNTEKHETKRFEDDNKKYYNIALGINRVDARSAPISEVMGAIAGALLLLLGGRDVINGVWSPGDFITFFYAVTKMYKPIKSFSNLNSQIQSGLASAERVFEILDEKPEIKNDKNAITLESFSKNIEYKNVTFGYLPDKDVIKNFNVTISRGETVAFVGHSGSGKTTIANLLLRFYDPKEGEILVDGHNIKHVTLESLRNQIGIVTQDVTLFDDTVKYNISYGSFDASTEDIIKAAKLANAHNFISKLPNGYDTMVGERGMKLSGGEKQRISIARAMLKNPPILVLDEATSALDSESEKLVQAAIDNLMKDRTVILIAHRLATVRNANNIIVMDKGQIIESGTHNDLIKLDNGVYKNLIRLQTL